RAGRGCWPGRRPTGSGSIPATSSARPGCRAVRGGGRRVVLRWAGPSAFPSWVESVCVGDGEREARLVGESADQEVDLAGRPVGAVRAGEDDGVPGGGREDVAAAECGCEPHQSVPASAAAVVRVVVEWAVRLEVV